jgi:hypothetical protein
MKPAQRVGSDRPLRIITEMCEPLRGLEATFLPEATTEPTGFLAGW